MEAFKLIPAIVLTLCVAGLIAGASLISLAEFGATMDKCGNSTGTYNATDKVCYNGSNYALGDDMIHVNLTDEYQSTLDSTSGIAKITEQFPTLGIIAVMVIIISILAGVFVYFKWYG